MESSLLWPAYLDVTYGRAGPWLVLPKLLMVNRSLGAAAKLIATRRLSWLDASLLRSSQST